MTDKIRLYNTRSRTLEEFRPLHEDVATVYSCGPTVYHYQHLGNMRAAVFADTLRRTLRMAGYEVKHIINITDVGHLTSDSDTGEDKLEKGAKREGKTVWEIARMYTDAYFKDLSSLNVPLGEYLFPRATDHIAEQIELVRKLEEKGYTYVTSDGVYFDTSRFERYAEFANLDVTGLQAGARVEDNGEKRNVTDFALWKFSPKDDQRQMEWDSPWGKGFPGWHIECSAMAMKYLGTHFDIHTGGIEHIPVHHTNEIAQSECATGETFANYWMHNNHLLDTTGKMSKSNGEFLTVSSLVEQGYNPLAYRYFLMGANYRKELLFSFEALDAAAAAYEKVIAFCRDHAIKHGKTSEEYMFEFKAAMYDDLNTAKAIATMWNMLKDIDITYEDRYATLMEMNKTLGLGLEAVKKVDVVISDDMKELLAMREAARKEKNFAESDRIRDEIVKRGFTIKDTAEGQQLTK